MSRIGRVVGPGTRLRRHERPGYLRDSTEPGKQSRAAKWMAYLWDTGRGRLSLQVLQECYVTVTGKLDSGLHTAEAREDVTAPARRLDCGVLLTEDMQDGQDLDRMVIRSSFTCRHEDLS